MDEKIINRLIKWANDEPAPPLRAEFWPTMRCNLKCRFCGVNNRLLKNESEISHKTLLNLVKECGQLGVEEMFISGGGEPLIRKHTVLSMMKLAKKLKMWGLLVTNGTLLKVIDIKKIVKIEWDHIAFSIDGPNAEIHDYLRNSSNAFKKVMENVKILNKIKKSMGKSKPTIAMWTVLTNKNFNKILDMTNLLLENGFNDFLIFSLRVSSPEAEKLKLNEREIKEFQKTIRNIEKVLKENNIKSNISEFRESKYIINANEIPSLILGQVKYDNKFLNIPCYEPWYYITIDSKGLVGPCAGITTSFGMKIGNFKLRDIWYKQLEVIRNQISSGKISNLCQQCCIDKIFHNKRVKEELRKRLEN